MGIKKRLIYAIAIGCLLLLSGCLFNWTYVNLYGVKISKVKASVSSAYFLSCDGVLYCTGADTDASSYVIYSDKNKGIVAENVKEFGEMLCGGYYIDNNSSLYIWNRDNLPLYGYQKGHTAMILSNVRFVDFSQYCMIYIDMQNNLYLAGEFGGERYDVSSPKLLAEDVMCADTNGEFVLWYSVDGAINSFGKSADMPWVDEINEKSFSKPIQEIQIVNDYLLLLSDGDLWFYGNLQKFISNNEKTKDICLKLLATEIIETHGGYSSIIALDSQGNVRLWGRIFFNSANNNDDVEYKYLNGHILASNGTSVYIADGCICYVDDQHNSKIYHHNGWSSSYGNSTKDNLVGINREPITWIGETGK